MLPRQHAVQGDLTAEVFGAHTIEGEGPYLRTGDLGFLSGGELFVTGRRKDLIILRGRNHYPQDLERSAEAAHPAVRPGCVNAFSIDEGGEERLVLVAEVQPERAEDLLAVATAITQRVAEGHDLLVHRVALTPPRALPKTSSGKLQRGACRAELLGGTLPLLRSWGGAELLGAYVRTRLASVLGVAPEQVDLERPLEALGVDSLALAELDASLDRTLGVRLGLGAMGAGVTVAALAAGLGAGGARRGDAEEAAAPAEEDREAASLIQEAIYRDHEALPGCHGISIGVRLLGEVREGALRDALHRLAARHGLLRCAFARSEGRLLRCPGAAAPELRVLDAAALSEGAVREVLAEEATAPFAIDAGPLMRALLLRRAPAEWLLVLSLHHLAYDAYSLLALAHELIADLGGALPRGAAEASDAADYARFVAWERRYLASAGCGRDEARLRTALSGAPLGVPLPPAGAAPRIQDQAAALLRADDVARAAAGRAATPHGLLLAAFFLGLGAQLGRDDLVVGTTVSLRDEPDLRAPMGPVFNYVPIRAALGGASTLDAALGPVRAGLAVARAARRFPLVRLLDQAGPQGAAGGPVTLGLNVNVSYYDLDRLAAGSPLRELNRRGETQIGALRVRHLPLADLPVVRPYDLNLGVTRTGGLLRLGLRYRRDLMARREADALLDSVVRALGLPAQRDERGPRG